jgi:ribonuclease P protein component
LSAKYPAQAIVDLVNAASREDRQAQVALRFPKSARLLKHSDFQHVYKNGKRHFSGLLTAFYLFRADTTFAGPRIGLTVGRALGGAVERNRIKRRMREAIRLHLPELNAPVNLVFNPKKSVLTAEFSQIEQEVKRAFEVVQKNAERLGPNVKLPERRRP